MCMAPAATENQRRVGLFVTCLVDLMRPSVGFAAVKLLQDAGCTVDVPPQTCCGQPAFNSGDRATARELGIDAQPRKLLAGVEGLNLTEMKEANVCCGFGGTFCVKYPAISDAIVTRKAENIAATGATTLLAGDLGCLMNMAGKLQRLGRNVRVRHVAEVLADMGGLPAIGEA